MNKSIYSDEELEQLFQNLFFEKKKVKDLEQKLHVLHQVHESLVNEVKQLKSSSVTQKHGDPEEIEKLKCLIATYKKKSAQAIHALYENEHQKIKQETSLAQQLKQLQAKVDELTEENSALLDQQKALRNRYDQIDKELKTFKKTPRDQSAIIKANELSHLYQEALSQNFLQKEQIEKLTTNLREQENRIRYFQTEETVKNSGNKHLETQFDEEKKINQALREENRELLKSIADSQKHSEQLERVLKHLRERSQEAQLEVNQLRNDFLRSQEAVTNLTEQLELSQSHLQDVTHQLNKIHIEKQEASEEKLTLENQFSSLKAKIIEVQNSLKSESADKKLLESKLADKSQVLNQLVNEITSIKRVLSTGVHEVKEIESRYLGLVNEKAALYQRSSHLEQLLDRHNSDVKALQDNLETANAKEETYKLQLQELEAGQLKKHQETMNSLQKRCQDLENTLKKHHEQLHEKELEIEETNKQLMSLSQEKMRLEETLINVTRYQDEQDARIKVAQQHLGKKVKEVALMNEKMEEQRTQINDLQHSLNQLKSKIIEMQSAFDQQMQHEKKNQEQLHETVRFAEGQVVRWEEKYLKAHEKLTVLEEKQYQMQALLANLGNVISTPVMASSPPATPRPSPSRQTLQLVDSQNIQFHSNDESVPTREEIQPSLFDQEQPRTKLRQNLFE